MYLALSSPGGNVQAGLALYTTLRAFPFNLVTHNIETVNSMGNVVFLAGDHRYATTNATFMFHGAGFNINGAVRLEEKEVSDRLDTIRADQTRMGRIVVERTQLRDDRVADLFRAQTTVDAGWAKDHGIIVDTRDFNIPAGSPVVSFVFQR